MNPQISGQEPAAQWDRQGSRLSDCSGVPGQLKWLINLPDTLVNQQGKGRTPGAGSLWVLCRSCTMAASSSAIQCWEAAGELKFPNYGEISGPSRTGGMRWAHLPQGAERGREKHLVLEHSSEVQVGGRWRGRALR